MNDSGFLSDLARTAREEEEEERQRWNRWDRLNDGDLSPEEEAELRALAATSEEDRRAFEAFRPLDSDFRARMVDTIGSLIHPVDSAPEPKPLPLPPPPLPFPWWRVGWFVGPGLAAASVLFLVHYWPKLTEPKMVVADSLDFKVQRVQPGIAVKRGQGAESEGPVELAAGGKFYTSAQPQTALSVEIEPRCYVKPKPAARKLEPVNCTATNQSEGAVEIAGSLPGDLPTGPATLMVVLAASGNQPSADTVEKLSTDHSTKEKTWFAGPQPIEILAP